MEIWEISSLDLVDMFYAEPSLLRAWIYLPISEHQKQHSNMTIEDVLGSVEGEQVKIHRIENIFKQMKILWPRLFRLSYRVKDVNDFRNLEMMTVKWEHLYTATGREKLPEKELYLSIHVLRVLYDPVYIDLP